MTGLIITVHGTGFTAEPGGMRQGAKRNTTIRSEA